MHPRNQSSRSNGSSKPKSGSVSQRIADRGREGLVLLLDSHDYSDDLGCDVWEFAVRINALRTTGLNENDFRWLMGKGLVKHAVETTHDDEEYRTFRTDRRIVFEKRSSFVLTEDGVRFVRGLGTDHGGEKKSRQARLKINEDAEAWGGETAGDEIAGDDTPLWDWDRHELRIGQVIVKKYRVPARNQETVLAVFQEEGWPVRIDDPLPQLSDINPKRRLHDTINALNRHQKKHLIQFRGDGQGEGVLWEFAAAKRKARRKVRSA